MFKLISFFALIAYAAGYLNHARTNTFLSGSLSHGLYAGKPKSAHYAGSSNGASSLKMMPIGVPKVAYRVPGAQQADWVDIYNRLYRERIMFLGQEIDDEIVNQLIGVMLYLDKEDNTRQMYLYINCPGGSVIAGLALYDTMNHIKSHVITVNLGLAASMASFILAAGVKGFRQALPHSRTMIHQPMGGAQGQAEDIRVEAAQIMRIRDNLVRQYAMMTGQTTQQIMKDLDRDNFLSAEQAQAYGLVDEISPVAAGKGHRQEEKRKYTRPNEESPSPKMGL